MVQLESPATPVFDAPPAPERVNRTANILQVTPRFPPYMGGVELHVAEIAPRLARLGLGVSILTTDADGRLPARADHDGVPIQRVRAFPRGRDYYLAPGLPGAIARHRPLDLVHIHSYQTFVAPVAMAAALRLRLPYVLTFHSGGHSSRLRQAIRGHQLAALRPLLIRAQRLVAVSQFELDYFSERLRIPYRRIVVIPNGGQLPEAGPAPRPDPDRPLILSVGRLEAYKGHQRVIAALPYLLETVPNARLRIAGRGPFEQELRRLAERLGVATRVEIAAVPVADRAAMASLYRRASVVTLLSDYEAQAISVAEALALGRPVVVAYAGGLMDFADRRLARAVPLDASPAAVAAAIVEQLVSPLPIPAIEIPTWEGCTEQLRALYLDVLGRRAPALR
jgi:glycosyltransferase involved in cell wall biosynthesis